jgi:hypothetical protein
MLVNAMAVVPFADAMETRLKQHARQIAMAEGTLQSATQVDFQTVEKGRRSGVREALQIAVRSQAEWSALWQKHASIGANPTPPTVIDFDKEIVVGVFLGEKPTGGYETEIIRAEQADDTLYVYYREISPQPGRLVTQALTQPFHIVRVPRKVNVIVIFRRDS